ncbi:RHS repeat-associated core domain-containing protein [Psychrobacter celer]|uniref:RHS repeat-associated core domain-containing protein n=1 Tax=Psychrobacter celer TaxID=306572 RepID=UPI003FD6B74E
MSKNTPNPDLPSVDKPKSGATAVGVSSLVASNNKGTLFDAGMSVASAMPGSKVAKAFGTVDALSRAASAANQGSMLGAGMALAGAVPGSAFSDVMSKVGATSNLMSALQSGAPMSIGMGLAGIAPGSPLAGVMGQVAQAKEMFDLGMSIFKPNINPADLIKYIQPPQQATETPSKSVAATYAGKDGSYVKGEGIKCEACALANQEAMVGAPVNALYGSKVLVGGDDIDYRGDGYLPFVMSRIYNSQNPDSGWFGQGWTTQGYEQRLELDPQQNRIYLIDNTGRRVPFTYLAPGHSCYQPSEGITLYRKPLADNKKHTVANARPIGAGATNGSRIGDHEPLEFILYQGDYNPKAHNIDAFNGVAQHYSYVASRRRHGTEALVLLSSYADKYGHQNQLHYTRSPLQGDTYLPQYLTDDADGCYEFEFVTVNEQPRLTSLYNLESLKSRQLLAEYTYSHEGDLIKVNVQGRTTREFAYTEHLMVWQSQFNGQQVAYQYDRYDNPKAARIIEQVISTGRHYLFEYDRDPNGQGITTVIEQPNSELERQRSYTYDDWYNMLSLTDPNGNTTRYEYDDNNRTIKVIRANGSHTNYNYQGTHLASVQVQTGIDPITQLPDYKETSYEYNQAGVLLAITDALGHQQKFKYNKQGEVTASIDSLSHTTIYSYDNHGNISQQTLANGSQFEFSYDEIGNLLNQTDCSGYRTHYKYNNNHKLVQITDASNNVTRYYYDNSGPWLKSRVIQIRYPDGSHIQMDYDDLGRLISHTDALGQQVTYQYNDNGLPSQRTEDNSHSIIYIYDTLGRLTTLKNENREEWTFNYDKADNLIGEKRFDSRQSNYHYDCLNQRVKRIDNPQLSRSKQLHIHLQYSMTGQITAQHSVHYPEQIEGHVGKDSRPHHHRMHNRYNLIGQLESATNRHSRTEFVYNSNGQIVQETLINHFTGDAQTLSYDYDELGNRVATTLPDGKVINQLYYGSGHLYNQSLHDPSTDEHVELRHSERNKLHQEISRQQGMLESNYDYDPMGRLIKQQSKIYHTIHGAKYSRADEHITIQRDYNYDALGQLTHLSGHSVLGNQTNQPNTANQHSQFTRNHQYQYDTQGRLTEHKLTDYQNQTGITEVFAFDPASNRVPVKTADNTIGNTENDHGRPRELIQNGKRIRYTYDSHGRVLYKTTEALTNPDKEPRTALQLQYNANSELEKSLRTQYQGNIVIKTLTEYHYDAFGRRIAKHSEIRNLVRNKSQLRQPNKTQFSHTHMLWDANLPIQEYSDTHVYTTIYDQESFEPVTRLTWLRDDLPKVANDDPSLLDNSHLSDKAEPKSNIQVYYYHNDQLGTPNELTNDKGEVVWLADYEAWGNTAKVIWQKQKLEQLQVSACELQPLRFQGQHYDTETGLHYNRFRYYDPDMGMFTSRDPIGLDGGMNVFAYAPNPTEWIDPLGLASTAASWGSDLEKANNARRAERAANKKPVTCSLKNTTSMTNLGVGVSVFAGAGVGASVGSSCSDEGIKNRCYSTNVCATAGAEASATGSFGQSITNAPSGDGWSSGKALCGAAKGVAGVGASIKGCKNSDGSETVAGNAVIGGGAGVSGEGCYTVTYCH